jgi:hypothetical protein
MLVVVVFMVLLISLLCAPGIMLVIYCRVVALLTLLPSRMR